MKRQFLVLALSSTLISVCAYAQAEVYLCIDQHGNREYKNIGITKGCKKVDLPGMTTIPSPRKTVQTASAKPVATPVDFPRVDDSVQKARDNDRRQILLDEMKNEEQKLSGLRREYNNGEPERRGDERNYAKYQERTAALKDDVTRSEKNVEALKRELANLK
jgi:hypothetical protein